MKSDIKPMAQQPELGWTVARFCSVRRVAITACAVNVMHESQRDD